MDYLRHPGVTGLMTSNLAASQIKVVDGGTTKQLRNVGDDADGDGGNIRTPFSVD
jgi:hypothetical protein